MDLNRLFGINVLVLHDKTENSRNIIDELY